MIYYDDDDVISKRLNRKRLKVKTYDNDFIDNEEQLMLNQVRSFRFAPAGMCGGGVITVRSTVMLKLLTLCAYRQ